MHRILIFLLFVTFNTLAVEPAVRFETLSIEDGLSQVSINGMLQDKQGFLWIATQDGLNRYDGYGFKVFRHDPNNAKSISNNFTRVIFQDSNDRIWIATNDSGFSLFEPQSETFVNYSFPPTTPRQADAQNVKAIVEDCHGYLWIGTYKGGLHRFDPKTQQFMHFMYSDAPNKLSHNRIWSLLVDKYCNLWIATNNGVDKLLLSKDITPDNAVFIHHKHSKTDPNSINHQRAYSLLEDSKGYLWVGTTTGLSRTLLTEKTNQSDKQPHLFKRFSLDFSHYNVETNNHNNNTRRDFIWSLFEDSSGRIWIGARGSGLYRFEPDSNKLHLYQNQGTDRYSLSNNIILSIIEDRQKQLWVGTFAGGLNKLNLQSLHFNHYKHDPSIAGSLSNQSIRSMIIDKNNFLWIATDNGLNRFDPHSKTFKAYKHDINDPASLSGNLLTNVYIDKKDNLWVGTLSKGINRYIATSNNFIRYPFNTDIKNSLSGSMVRYIFEDSNGQLWIMTNSALNLFDHKTQQFSSYLYFDYYSSELKVTDALSVYEDPDGLFWLGSDGYGMLLFNPKTGKFLATTEHIGNNLEGIKLGLERVYYLHKSQNNILWMATNNGLGKFDLTNKNFKLYQSQHGLPNNVVIGILEDSRGHLWLSTNKGLAWFKPNSENFVNFTSKDGLQSDEFNSRSFYRSPEGELFFGGINGFNRFFVHQIKQDTNPPNVVLTDFLDTNQSVAIKPHATTKQQNFTLTKAIDQLEHITLSHQQNLIAIEFSGLHFVAPDKNQYAYKLEGQDQQWIYTDSKNRRATYTNLAAGEYQFRVKASNPHQVWQERQKRLKITVLPPPWRTWWAYSLYAVVIGLILAYIISFYIRKQRLELTAQQLELAAQRQKNLDQQKLNLQLKHIDKLKDQFLANTSHELRTPLNGIIGLAESLLDGATGPLGDATKKNLSMIMASGRRLSNLVNDILDFSKLENHNLKLNPRPVDLHSLVEIVIALSKPSLGDKKLSLINNIDPDLPAAWADENRLEQIFHNLVGNAIKFTQQGSITLSATQSATNSSTVITEQLTVSVTDTGIGIAPEHFDHIFKSFEQLEEHTTRNQSGTGLGLSVTKQLVELHGGSITVESTPQQGSTFSFTLPICKNQKATPQSNAALQQTLSKLNAFEHTTITAPVEQSQPMRTAINSKKFTILLVDDEPINRQVISNILTIQQYQLVEASSGEQALQLIESGQTFDLLLLDIMMPRISGFEVCQRLRQQYSVSELPIIFLTAKNQVNDLVESFNIGANDYLSKPISKNELLARVETHLQMLDINKNLEDRVKQRTEELQQSLEQLKTTQKQLIEAEKMATLGSLVAGVAHEVNTPLGICITMVSLQLEKVKSFETQMTSGKLTRKAMDNYINETVESQNVVQLHLNRCAALVQEFKEVAVEQSNSNASTIVFHQYLEKVVDSLIKKLKHQAITITIESQGDWTINTYPNAWWQIIERLFDNSRNHAFAQQPTGEITIKATIENDTVTLTYRDNGQGMNQEQLDKIYEPFYTTIRNNGGTGLGMHIVFNLAVHKLKGEIDCISAPNQGVEFVIKVPVNHV